MVRLAQNVPRAPFSNLTNGAEVVLVLDRPSGISGLYQVVVGATGLWDRAVRNVGMAGSDDLLDRPTKHVGEIDRVAEDVGRHAMSGPVELEAPRQQAHRVGAVHREEPTVVVGDLAKRSVIDQLLGVLHQRRPAIVVADAGDHTCGAGSGFDPHGLFGVPPTGFSQNTCLPARLRRWQSARAACSARRAHNVDVRVIDRVTFQSSRPVAESERSNGLVDPSCMLSLMMTSSGS